MCLNYGRCGWFGPQKMVSDSGFTDIYKQNEIDEVRITSILIFTYVLIDELSSFSCNQAFRINFPSQFQLDFSFLFC